MYQHGSSAGLVSLCVCALSALVLSAPALDAAGPAGGEPTLQDVELLRAWLEEQSAGDGDLYAQAPFSIAPPHQSSISVAHGMRSPDSTNARHPAPPNKPAPPAALTPPAPPPTLKPPTHSLTKRAALFHPLNLYSSYTLPRSLLVVKTTRRRRPSYVGKRSISSSSSSGSADDLLHVLQNLDMLSSASSPVPVLDAEKRGRMFVGKREGLDQDDLLDEDKRARMFVGKRARMFVGKKSADDWESGEWDDEKRARMFVGKRSSYQPRQARRLFIGKRGGYDMEDMYDEDKRARMFVGKRGRMFVGKKSADDWDFNDLDEEKRARMFVGKRRLFVGRRSEEDDKRGRMFVGRRSDGGNMVDDKRARIFVGKRSAEVVSDDDVTIQDGSASS